MTLKSRVASLAERMPDELSELQLWSFKFCLLLLIDEVDIALDYAHPGRCIDQMLGANANLRET